MWWFCFKTCDTNQHTSLPRLKNGHRNSHFGWRAGTIWYLYCFYKSGFRSVSGKGHERFGFHHSWKIPRLSDVMCRFNLCESLFYIGISTYYVWVPQGNPSFLQLPDDIATSPFRQKKQLIDLALNLNSWGSDDRSVACHFFRARNQEAINSINPSNGRWWWNGQWQNIAIMVQWWRRQRGPFECTPPASTARTPRSQRLLEGSSRSHDRVTFAVENGSRCGSRSCLMKGVFLVHSLTHWSLESLKVGTLRILFAPYYVKLFYGFTCQGQWTVPSKRYSTKQEAKLSNPWTPLGCTFSCGRCTTLKNLWNCVRIYCIQLMLACIASILASKLCQMLDLRQIYQHLPANVGNGW